MNSDRAHRLQKIAEEMSELAKEVGPKLIRLAHLRKEARQILEEAGVDVEAIGAGERH